jgi:hypothetical protein
MVTSVPSTVQVSVVLLVTVTARPEVLVGATANEAGS